VIQQQPDLLRMGEVTAAGTAVVDFVPLVDAELAY
jgi:hypothetical protein